MYLPHLADARVDHASNVELPVVGLSLSSESNPGPAIVRAKQKERK